MKKAISGFLLLVLAISAYAANGKDISKSLKLDASSKAIKQWERIFSTPEKMAALGIDKLSAADKAVLQKYLTSHAADSDHPEAAGL